MFIVSSCHVTNYGRTTIHLAYVCSGVSETMNVENWSDNSNLNA